MTFQETSVTQCVRLLRKHGVDNVTSLNVSDDVTLCTDVIPFSHHVFRLQSAGATVALAVAWLLCLLVLALYLEQFIFIRSHFISYGRRSKTLVITGLYPVFSLTSLLGFMVPRAGTLVDLVANIYLSVCLLYVMRLLLDYMGGLKRARHVLDGAPVSLRAPPCCCCCPCLPLLTYDRAVGTKFYLLVMQVAIVRPLLMLIAAVLWVDGVYIPGVISATNAYIYITVINMASSMSAIYALNVFKNVFNEPLKQFAIGGKLVSVQLVIILSVIFNLVINILVQNDVIMCDELFSSKARGERIYHVTMVVLMVPLCILGRANYRKAVDGAAGDTQGDIVLEDKVGDRHHRDANSNEKS